MSPKALQTIGEYAERHGLSADTLRLYEQRGLFGSSRPADARRYGEQDDARLALILRGKRMGLSLTDICRFVGLLTARESDAAERTQLLELLEKQIAALVERRNELDLAIAELEAALGTRDPTGSEPA